MDKFTDYEEAKLEAAQDAKLVYSGRNAEGELEFIGTDKQWKDYQTNIEDMENCDHQCISNCRREGCNCGCGEYHITK